MKRILEVADETFQAMAVQLGKTAVIIGSCMLWQWVTDLDFGTPEAGFLWGVGFALFMGALK